MVDHDAAIHHDREPRRHGDPRRFGAHDPKLEPEATSARGHRLVGVLRARVCAPEDIDDVHRAGGSNGSGQVRVTRQALDLPFPRVDRHDVVPGRDQIAKDLVGGPVSSRRGTDHRDAAARSQQVRDFPIVEDRHTQPAILQVERVLHVDAIGRVYVALSRSYGWPSAAGGMLLPMRPASTTMVAM